VRVAVVGAGIVGAAAGRALARRGHEVVVHEQFMLDHTRGSSHGASRIYRTAYPEREWVELARESIARWRELEAETGEELLVPLGLLEIGGESAPALEAAGIEFERRGDDVFQRDAGIIRADRARAALLRGLDVREHSRVDPGSVEADVVVVAAGAWAKRMLGLPVVVTRETVCYFDLAEPRPSLIEHRDAYFYALHDPGGRRLKAGIHMGGVECEPDEEGKPDVGVVGRVTEWIEERYPDAGPLVATETCLYTTTIDERFILTRRGRIVIGSACSGHGFKFAPTVGERLADLAESETRGGSHERQAV
jgi:sarcosine oxidase